MTLDQIDELLPQLEAIFERLDSLRDEIAARSNELERLAQNLAPIESPEDHVVARRGINRTRVEDYHKEIEKIEAMGAILMDPDLCIVDFPATVDGHRVHVCWQRGEAGATHYRIPGADFARRRRIPPRRD